MHIQPPAEQQVRTILEDLEALRERASAEGEMAMHLILHCTEAAYRDDLASRGAKLGRQKAMVDLARSMTNLGGVAVRID